MDAWHRGGRKCLVSPFVLYGWLFYACGWISPCPKAINATPAAEREFCIESSIWRRPLKLGTTNWHLSLLLSGSYVFDALPTAYHSMMENCKLLSRPFVFGELPTNHWTLRSQMSVSVRNHLAYMSYFARITAAMWSLWQFIAGGLSFTRSKQGRIRRRRTNSKETKCQYETSSNKQRKSKRGWFRVGRTWVLQRKPRWWRWWRGMWWIWGTQKEEEKKGYQKQNKQKDQERLSEKRPQEKQTWKETCWQVVWVWWTYKYWICFFWIWKGFSGWTPGWRHCRHAGNCSPACTWSWTTCKRCDGGTVLFKVPRLKKNQLANSLLQASQKESPAARTSNQCQLKLIHSPAQSWIINSIWIFDLLSITTVQLNFKIYWFCLKSFWLVDFCQVHHFDVNLYCALWLPRPLKHLRYLSFQQLHQLWLWRLACCIQNAS